MSWTGKRSVLVSAGRLSVVEAGDPDAPAIVLLHGFPTSSYLWRELIPMFAPVSHVIAPDLPGAGDSGAEAVDLVAQADATRELLAEVGVDRFAVIGHGSGGGLAQLLALDGTVDALVLIGSDALGDPPAPAYAELRATAGAAATTQEARDGVRRAFELGMGHPERLSDEVLAEHLRPFEGASGAAALSRWARASDASSIERRDDELAALGCPVLLVWGEDDAFSPVERAERMNERIDTSVLAELPGCGHFVTEDAPEAVIPVLYEYVRGRYLGQPHAHGGPQGGPIHVPLERRLPG